MGYKRSITFGRSKIFLICVCVLLLPTNHLGIPIKPKNFSNNQPEKGYDIKLSISQQLTNGQPIEYAEHSYFQVDIVLVIWISVILLLSAFLHIIIFGYLNSQPLNKQCLLLYLYGDAFKLLLVHTWLLVGLAIFCKIRENVIKETEAKVISYGMYSLRLGFLLSLNAGVFLKLFMKKSRVLDPIVVYCGYDDDTAIKITRCLISFLVIAFAGILYINEIYPQGYYYLHELEANLTDLPTGTLIAQLLIIILLLICALLHIVSTRRRMCPFLGKIEFCTRDNDTEQDGSPSIGDYIFVPVVWAALVVFSLGFLLLNLMGIFPTTTQWISILLKATVGGNVLPTIIILNSAQLKDYAKRKITQTTAPFLLCLEVAFTSLMWIRRSTRIMPAE